MIGGSRRAMLFALGIVCIIAAAVLISAGTRAGRRPAPAPAPVSPAPATASPRPTLTPTPAPTAKPTPSPAPTAKPSPTPSPAPTASPTPTPSPAPTATPSPAPTATPPAKPAVTPWPAPTPAAKPTPAPATSRPAPTHAPATRAPATRAPAARATPSNAQSYVGGRPNDACLRALTYITTAANEHITRIAVYNAARAGLEENVHCAEPRRSVNEAYLLAMLAPAEFTLGRGDWRRDLDRSNRLLEQCVRTPGFSGSEVADDCAKQRSYNDTVRSIIERSSARRGS